MSYVLGDCLIEAPYRYSLEVSTSRTTGKKLVVIQCNPSVATGQQSDPTVGKVAMWAIEHGFSKVVFLNLFALISPYASALAGKSYEEIVGPKNDEVLREQLRSPSCTVVLGWGGGIPVPKALYLRRVHEVKQLLRASGHEAHHVGALSYGTHPRHGRMWNTSNRDLRVLNWDVIER